MTSAATLGLESAVVLLGLASLAAVQARAVRGAERRVIQELCHRRRRPERYEEIVAASETIAFIASSVVVIASAVATLLAFRGLVAAGDGSLAIGASAVVGWIALAWAVLVVVPLLLVKFAGPWIVVATWTLWRPVVGLIGPAVRHLGRVAGLLAGFLGRRGGAAPADRPREELRLVVEEAHREGRLEGEARDMIRGVIALDEVRVAAVMTPRTSVISIPAAAPWEEAVRLAAESGHTRLPVWGKSPDDVVGILHTRDVLRLMAEGFAATAAPPAIGSLLRPPWFVPESMSVQKLLQEFRRGNTHMAVVTDEFGGVSGVVTIEDALEEIVGEIADEHDEAFADGMRMLSPEACEALAHVRIEALNRRLGVALPEEEDFETIGGFVFHQFGRIPEVGERIESHGVRLEVLEATRRRIDLVRVERLAPGPAGGPRDGR
jgi:CBS domain containing-hemolysin-like protein